MCKMKTIHKLMAIMLSIAMAVGMMPVSTATETDELPIGASSVIIAIEELAADIVSKSVPLGTSPASNNANLTDITPSCGKYRNIDGNNYTLVVPSNTTFLALTPSLEDDKGSIEINGLPVENNTESQTISFINDSDSIEVKVTAEDGTTVNVYMVSVLRNKVPVALDDIYDIDEDESMAILKVLNNDEELDEELFWIESFEQVDPKQGELQINPERRALGFAPAPDYNGTVQFNYTVTDGLDVSNEATVTINIAPINDEPIANDDIYFVNMHETIDISDIVANDTDADGDHINVNFFSQPPGSGHLNLTLVDDGGFDVIYTPVVDFYGVDTFLYQVNDGKSYSKLGNVVVTVNAPPTGEDTTYDINEDSILTEVFPVNDPEGDSLSYEIVTPPVHGEVNVNQSEVSFSYTPTQNFFGTDSFIFKANDGKAESEIYTITINVLPVNDTPIPVNASYLVRSDRSFIGKLTATDVDGDSLTFTLKDYSGMGDITVYPDGSFLFYSYSSIYFGTFNFSFIVNDGTTNSSVGMVTLTVNSPPEVLFFPDRTTLEDTAISGSLIPFVYNWDGDPLNFVLISPTDNGTLSLRPDGTYEYVPDKDFCGSDSFIFKVSDGKHESLEMIAGIDVVATNDAPVVYESISLNCREDGTVTIPKTRLGYDVDHDYLSVEVVSGPAHGTVDIYASYYLDYTPKKDYYGTDSYQVRLFDGTEYSAVGTVTITITPENDAPVAKSLSFTIPEDEVLNAAADASDVDMDELVYSVVSNPSHGSVSMDQTGQFVYTPSKDYYGEDSFTYKATDTLGLDSNTVSVKIIVEPVNDAPVANDDHVSIKSGIETVVDVLANDFDVDMGDELMVSIETSPLYGTITMKEDGSIGYTPKGAVQPDSFTYKIVDLSGASDTAVVFINSLNNPPAAADKSFVIEEDGVLTGTLLGSDVDGDVLTYTLVQSPEHGTVTILPNGSFTYRPYPDYHGRDSFTYQVSDGEVLSNIAVASITITAPNDSPISYDYSLTTDEDTAYSGSLSADDIEGDTLNYSVYEEPGHGRLNLASDGKYTYTPDKDFFGKDSFSYKVGDRTISSGKGTVAITVNPVNDAPETKDSSFAVNLNTTLYGKLDASDVDHDFLTYIITTLPKHGEFITNPDGSFSYNPSTDYVGQDEISFMVKDSGGLKSNASKIVIQVNVSGAIPKAADDAAEGNEDSAFQIKLLENDTGMGKDGWTVALDKKSEHGQVSIDKKGVATYVPVKNYFGSDSFTYRLSVGKLTDSAVVDITIKPVNDAPTISDIKDMQLGKGEENKVTEFTIDDIDTAVDKLTLSVASSNKQLIAENGITIKGSGSKKTLTVVPIKGQTGTSKITITVSDGEVKSSRDFNVTVKEEYTIEVRNDSPTKGNVSGGGRYLSGSPVTITAAPQKGFKFAYWMLNGNIVGLSPSVTFKAEKGSEYIAYFWEVEEINSALQSTSGNNPITFDSGVTMMFSETVDNGLVGVTKTDASDAEIPAGLNETGIFLNLKRSPNLDGKEIRLEVSYDLSKMSHSTIEDSLKLYHYNEETRNWDLVENQGIDKDRKVIWAVLDHFSTFAVFGQTEIVTPDPTDKNNVDQNKDSIRQPVDDQDTFKPTEYKEKKFSINWILFLMGTGIVLVILIAVKKKR